MSHKQSYGAHLGARGRLVIPAELRARFGWREGDRMMLIVGPDGIVRLESRDDVVERGLGLFAHLGRPGQSVVDELIAERRAEAAAEEAEAREYEATRE
jgi:AbrB family looped-hinge helix DNA binding protein